MTAKKKATKVPPIVLVESRQQYKGSGIHRRLTQTRQFKIHLGPDIAIYAMLVEDRTELTYRQWHMGLGSAQMDRIEQASVQVLRLQHPLAVLRHLIRGVNAIIRDVQKEMIG